MGGKRRQQRPRAIPQQDETWAERTAAAAAGDQFVADLDGEGPSAHWVIRRRDTRKIFERFPTVTKSEAEDRVALLNRGPPTRADNQSWGKLTKEGARPGKGVKGDETSGLSATEWTERLVGDPETSAELRKYVAQERALSLDDLAALLTQVDEYERDFTEKFRLLEAVSMQLYRKFGIRRAEGGRREC